MQNNSNCNFRIKAGLIGRPLKRSLSPLLFRLFSSRPGVKYSYAALETRGTGLARTLARIRRGGWAGFNVTLPLKEKIIPLLDSLTPEAGAIGAVNAVKRAGRKLRGHNTDAAAFLSALKNAKADISGKTCAIWGAGGAARAAAWALARRGAAEIYFHARSSAKAERLAAHFRKIFPRATFKTAPFGAKPAAGARVFVNATPLGMYKPLPPALKFRGPARALYCDFAYARGITPFLKNKAGTRISGLDLLVLQALKSHEFWTGANFRPREIVELKERTIERLKTEGYRLKREK